MANTDASERDSRNALFYSGLSLCAMLLSFWGLGFLILLGPGLLARALTYAPVERRPIRSFFWGVAFAGIFHFWALLKDWPLWFCLLLLKGGPWALFPVPEYVLRKWGPNHQFVRPLGYGCGLALVAWVLLLGPGSFDWETPMAALADWAWCLALLPWLGLVGSAFVIGLASSLLCSGRLAMTGLGVALVFSWGGLSWLEFSRTPSVMEPPGVRIALVQTGWIGDEKWRPENWEAATRRLITLTEAAQEEGATMVVWPETAWPTRSMRKSPADTRILSQLAHRLGVELLASSIEQEEDGWANSVSQITSTGRFSFEHQKQRLIPVQEYLPVPTFIETWLRDRGWVRRSCKYRPGRENVIFPTADSRFGVLICYESTSPGPASEISDQVDFFVVVTNDSPTGLEFPKEAHFRSAILRAAQFRKPTFQAGNSGVTGFIDSRGTVRKRTLPGFTGPELLML